MVEEASAGLISANIGRKTKTRLTATPISIKAANSPTGGLDARFYADVVFLIYYFNGIFRSARVFHGRGKGFFSGGTNTDIIFFFLFLFFRVCEGKERSSSR